MKKLILTSVLLSISTISACTPAIGGNPALNLMMKDMSSKKITKAQAIKYFNCVKDNATNKSLQLPIAHQEWIYTVNNILDSEFNNVMSQDEAESMTKAYGNTACKFE